MLNKFIVDIIKNKLGAVTIFLFGSIARGATHNDSDLDLAFLSPSSGNGYDIFLVA
jgi:hypothetical protein